jgi:hypothetical protein
VGIGKLSGRPMQTFINYFNNNATTVNEQKVMTKALYPQDRETFFKTIGVTNQRKNYKK